MRVCDHKTECVLDAVSSKMGRRKTRIGHISRRWSYHVRLVIALVHVHKIIAHGEHIKKRTHKKMSRVVLFDLVIFVSPCPCVTLNYGVQDAYMSVWHHRTATRSQFLDVVGRRPGRCLTTFWRIRNLDHRKLKLSERIKCSCTDHSTVFLMFGLRTLKDMQHCGQEAHLCGLTIGRCHHCCRMENFQAMHRMKKKHRNWCTYEAPKRSNQPLPSQIRDSNYVR